MMFAILSPIQESAWRFGKYQSKVTELQFFIILQASIALEAMRRGRKLGIPRSAVRVTWPDCKLYRRRRLKKIACNSVSDLKMEQEMQDDPWSRKGSAGAHPVRTGVSWQCRDYYLAINLPAGKRQLAGSFRGQASYE
ncbi:hypothetical protein OSTOST_11907, partial [Ostertagia ostertagi]